MIDRESYNKQALYITAGVLILLGGLTIYLWNASPSKYMGIEFLWIMRILYSACLVAIVAIIIGSFTEVGPDETGVLILFGKPKFQISSGLIYVLPPYKLQKETKLVIEEQYPEDEVSNNGKPSPIFITHGTSDSPSSDPLDNRITTAVCIVCRYKIVDLKKFITSIGNKEQLRRQIRDIVVTTAQVECSKQTVGKNYSRMPEINSKLKSEVERLTDDWGIQIVTVLLQNIDLGGAINDALRNVPISIINKEVNKNNAQKIYYEGLAEAEVHKAFQYAKTEGYKVIARELNIPEPSVIYQIDTLANMWRKNNADINLYSGDMAEVFKMVTAFSKIANNKLG